MPQLQLLPPWPYRTLPHWPRQTPQPQPQTPQQPQQQLQLTLRLVTTRSSTVLRRPARTLKTLQGHLALQPQPVQTRPSSTLPRRSTSK